MWNISTSYCMVNDFTAENDNFGYLMFIFSANANCVGIYIGDLKCWNNFFLHSIRTFCTTCKLISPEDSFYWSYKGILFWVSRHSHDIEGFFLTQCDLPPYLIHLEIISSQKNFDVIRRVNVGVYYRISSRIHSGLRIPYMKHKKFSTFIKSLS